MCSSRKLGQMWVSLHGTLPSRIKVLAACAPATDSNRLVCHQVSSLSDKGRSSTGSLSISLDSFSAKWCVRGTTLLYWEELRIKRLEHITDALYLNTSKKFPNNLFLRNVCVYFYCSTVARETLSSSQAILKKCYKMTGKCLYCFQKADTHFR